MSSTRALASRRWVTEILAVALAAATLGGAGARHMPGHAAVAPVAGHGSVASAIASPDGPPWGPHPGPLLGPPWGPSWN